MCEVEGEGGWRVGGGGAAWGPAAHRDLYLNEEDKSIPRWTKNTTAAAADKCFVCGREHESRAQVNSHSIKIITITTPNSGLKCYRPIHNTKTRNLIYRYIIFSYSHNKAMLFFCISIVRL